MIRHSLAALFVIISAAVLLLVAIGLIYEKILAHRQAAREKDSPYVIYITEEYYKYSDGHYIRCLDRINAKYKHDDQGNLLVQSAALKRVVNSCN